LTLEPALSKLINLAVKAKQHREYPFTNNHPLSYKEIRIWQTIHQPSKGRDRTRSKESETRVTRQGSKRRSRRSGPPSLPIQQTWPNRASSRLFRSSRRLLPKGLFIKTRHPERSPAWLAVSIGFQRLKDDSPCGLHGSSYNDRSRCSRMRRGRAPDFRCLSARYNR
jgi:hypothetical protein